MPRKLTYEYVKNFFIEQNCKLLSSEYCDSKKKLHYKCKCGNKSYITFSDFKQGKRCSKCGGTEKLTYEYVKNYFTEQGCELLETLYKNNSTKMNYKCSCGNKSKIIFNNFKKGQRCATCYGNEKFTYEYVKNYFKEQNCELFSLYYINIDKNLDYICICNNISQITFYNFKNNVRCQHCSGNEKLTYEYVNNYFTEQGCELLETIYKNNRTKMKYKCKCNNNSEITFSNFQKYKHCMECGIEKSMKNAKLFKDYILPSGKIIRIQGYENIALDELIKTYNENDIITNRKEMPKIFYYFNGKQHRYYPDIWIKSINKIIEVKSIYTYNISLIKNIIKALYTKKKGYDFEFWIYINKFIKKDNKIII